MTTAPFPAAVIAGVRVAARDHLRVTGTAEDMVIDRLAETALELAEAYTGTALIARPHEAMMAAARRLPIPAYGHPTGRPCSPYVPCASTRCNRSAPGSRRCPCR